MQETKSICCYCGVGCGVIIATDAARISGVRGDPDHPANSGSLCTKGATLHLSARHDTRALYPEQREARSLARSRVSWDEALDHIAVKFAPGGSPIDLIVVNVESGSGLVGWTIAVPASQTNITARIPLPITCGSGASRRAPARASPERSPAS